MTLVEENAFLHFPILRSGNLVALRVVFEKVLENQGDLKNYM